VGDFGSDLKVQAQLVAGSRVDTQHAASLQRGHIVGQLLQSSDYLYSCSPKIHSVAGLSSVIRVTIDLSAVRIQALMLKTIV